MQEEVVEEKQAQESSNEVTEAPIANILTGRKCVSKVIISFDVNFCSFLTLLFLFALL